MTTRLKPIVAAAIAMVGLTLVATFIRCDRSNGFEDTRQLKELIEAKGELKVTLDNEKGSVGNVVISEKAMTAEQATVAITRRVDGQFVHIFDQPESFKGIVYAVNVTDHAGRRYQDNRNARLLGRVYLVGDADLIARLEQLR